MCGVRRGACSRPPSQQGSPESLPPSSPLRVQFNPSSPSGQVSVWGSFIPGTPANYYSNQMLSSLYGQWSCFTYAINLKQVGRRTLGGNVKQQIE